MFTGMIKKLPCPYCETGNLIYNQIKTVESWNHPTVFRLDDIDKLKDGIISDILVFVCDNCEAEERQTFKEVEKKFRKRLSDIMLTQIAQNDMPDPGTVRKIDRTLIYCGKCGGFDGKGACPSYIYKDCKLKRLPYEL
jgi:hypothetical protein